MPQRRLPALALFRICKHMKNLNPCRLLHNTESVYFPAVQLLLLYGSTALYSSTYQSFERIDYQV